MVEGMKEYYADLSKANAEFERMAKGEIPFDPDYLQELVESNDDDLKIEFDLTCECGATVESVECGECKILPREDCPMCEGAGWFLDCPKCNGGESIRG